MAAPRTARLVHAVMVVLALLLTVLMVRPFASALFVAAVFAAALYPFSERLARLLRGRRPLAAGLVTLVLLLAVVGPVATLTAMLVGQVGQGLRWARDALQSGGLEGLVASLPQFLHDPAAQLLAGLPQGAQEVQALLEQEGARAAAAIGSVLSATGTALLQTVLFLVAFFFLLVDGDGLVQWIKEAIPLKPGQAAELFEDFRRVTVAVLASTVATAGAQAALALLGYLVAGVPNALFFGVVTFVVALAPIGLATLLVVALAVLKIATGHLVAGIFLAAWAVGVVATIDNVVKPLLMRRGLAIHPVVIFFAFIGGMAAFGPVGLLLGPLAVAFLIAVVRLYRRDYGGAR
ncbi:MAG TPA: AI-2E family transporter [Anaeromyxobacteraceae bacterium]|nr:AI-2E family transporter [Anaeromyxobacteraceae bacterium]